MSDDLYVGPTALAPGPKQSSGRGDRIARLILIPLFVLLAMLVLVFFVLFRPVRIDGPSMLPTLRSGDRVLVTRGDQVLERGDVVVMIVDQAEVASELVKRVIAVAGDKVEIREDVAYVNGTREPEYGQVVNPGRSVDVAEITVPEGYVYLMGDNRPLSQDSRFIGPAPLTGLLGKVVAVFAPIQRVQLVR